MIVEHRDPNGMENTGDMNSGLVNKMDPRYIAACIEEQPTLTDPQEVAIIEITKREAVSTPLGQSMVDKVRRLVKNNWQDQYAHRHDASYVHAKNQEGVAEFARITNAIIVSGEEKLRVLEKGKPVLFSANHVGFYKLAGLSPQELADLGFDGGHPVEDIHYPHIPFYAALYPVANLLNDDICMAAEEEPGTLGELYGATGSIDVPPASVIGDRVNMLTEATRKLFEMYPSSALTVFTEGGTTGKRNGGNTRELGKFHTGLFVIASKLELPVVLLAHRFDPASGFKIAVADVLRINKESTREEIQEVAARARGVSQAALDQLYVS